LLQCELNKVPQGAATEIWMLRACIVQGSQQIWVAALWYWGFQLQGAEQGKFIPWWIVLIVWPLAAICFLFSYLMLFGLPGKQFHLHYKRSGFSSPSRILSPDSSKSTEFPQDAVQKETCPLVLGI
jgi:hypothetical protein